MADYFHLLDPSVKKQTKEFVGKLLLSGLA